MALGTGVLVASCSRAPSVHFAREEVAVTVRPGTVEVLANYHFKVRAAKPFSALVFYPFPLDEFHAWPDSIGADDFRILREQIHKCVGLGYIPVQIAFLKGTHQ